MGHRHAQHAFVGTFMYIACLNFFLLSHILLLDKWEQAYLVVSTADFLYIYIYTYVTGNVLSPHIIAVLHMDPPGLPMRYAQT